MNSKLIGSSLCLHKWSSKRDVASVCVKLESSNITVGHFEIERNMANSNDSLKRHLERNQSEKQCPCLNETFDKGPPPRNKGQTVENLT